MTKSAHDYAVEAAEPFDAARSTDDKVRPLSITSADEAKAAAGLRTVEVETEDVLGHRQVVRVEALNVDEAVQAVVGDRAVVHVYAGEPRPA
jgi:hypothetical protein